MKPNLAGLVLLLVAVTAAAPGQPAPRVLSPAAKTVEPTLSVRLDLGLEGMERGRGLARGRLRLSLQAIDEVSDVAIVLVPDPLLSIPEAASLPRSIGRLRAGERREFDLAIEAPEDRDRPLRATVQFRAPDGTLQQLGAGITLTSAQAAPVGRYHAGALEYPALILPWPRP
ncbi:MAG TPA: hypothetical protein VGS03_00610 [Candidatus Polarisedimenticolia bacterium]|jgi:hypothetical protein|nr:hypothetical protein [Candidatus Polarisedimenticolia bacterium]